MKNYTPVEAIIACAEVLRREDRNIDVNRVAALMRNIYEIADTNGEEPSYVAKCLVTHNADELVSSGDPLK